MFSFRPLALATTTLLSLALSTHAYALLRGSEAAFQDVSKIYLARSDDSDLDLLTPAGIAARITQDHRLLGRLGGLNRDELSRNDQVDAALLVNSLRYESWRYSVLKQQDWDIQGDEDLVRGEVSALADGDGDKRARLLAAIPRLNHLPDLLAKVRAQIILARTPANQAALVAQQNHDLLHLALEPLLSHRSELSAADKAQFDAAAGRAQAAFASYQGWLDDLAAHGSGDFRLGARLYDAKVRFEFMAPLSRPKIEEAARRATDDIRRQMYDVARALPELKARARAHGWGDRPDAAQQQSAIEAGLAVLQSHHPQRSAFIDAIKADLASSTAFVKARQLVSVPDRPVPIVDMPASLRGIVPAFFESLGDHGVFAVSPIPTDWDAAQAEDYLRAHNYMYLENLTVHEAMPGHYLQSMHMQGTTSPLRRALGVRVFAEGWAVYAQRMMVEQGYLDHSPLYKLSELSWRLYMTCNALLDIGVQTQNMSYEEGIRLLTQVCFEPASSAEAQWRRATYTSAQLLTYFVGYTQMISLRDEVQSLRGADFSLKAYHDSLLSHGMPPIRFVRELMLRLPIR